MKFEKGIKFRENGELEKALEYFTQMLKNEEENASILYQIAWCLDILEREKEAIYYYEKSIDLGLSHNDMKGAYLGLGSTYRTIGEYEKSLKIFDKAILHYPDNNEFKVFRAMTNYNLGNCEESMKVLLEIIAKTSSDEGINTYKNAIMFYSNNLNQIW